MLVGRRRSAALLAAALVVSVLVWRAQPAASAGGAVDTTFGTSGVTTLHFGGSSADVVTDLAVGATGTITALVDTTAGIALARFTSAGILDTTFGTGGISTDTNLAEARGLVLQTDGKPVVVGRSGGNLVIARYTTGGDPDTTFDGDGRNTVAVSDGGIDVALSAGNLVTLGVNSGALVLHRFTSAGALDGTFSTVATGATPTGTDRLAVQADGKVVITGMVGTTGGIFRFNTNGTVDNSFTTANHEPRAVAVSGTNVVYAGRHQSSALVARLTATGAFDPTFGTSGVAAFGVTGMTAPVARAVTVATDGKVVVAGRENTGATSTVFVARLTATGALDTTFATGGIATFAQLGSLNTVSADGLGLDSTSRILLGAGVVSTRGDNDAAVARVTVTDGTGGSSSSSSSTSSTTSTTQPGQTAAGGSRSSDSAGTVPTDADRVVATVTTPVAGPVTFTKPATLPTITGHRPIGAISVTAPTATAADPLRLALTVNVGSVPATVPVASIAVLRDGAVVPTCTSATIAAPDPCLLTRNRAGDLLTVSMLTSRGSTWSVTRPVLERVAPATAERGSTSSAGDVAIAASRHAFPRQTAGAVVLARVDDFADALAGVPLAERVDAPILLTSRSSLDDAVLVEITRVLAAGRTVYLLGGEAALSSAVEARLLSWGYDVERYAGADRYETAVAIAEDALDSPRTVIETTGTNFADALAAGAIAARLDAAVLLTNGSAQSSATAAYLSRHRPTRYALGGPSATADPTATAVAGRDRYETAILAARRFYTAPVHLAFAPGYTYTDAVTAGAHAARGGAPLLLLPASGALPVSVDIYLGDQAATRPTATVYGSTTNVAADVATAIQNRLVG